MDYRDRIIENLGDVFGEVRSDTTPRKWTIMGCDGQTFEVLASKGSERLEQMKRHGIDPAHKIWAAAHHCPKSGQLVVVGNDKWIVDQLRLRLSKGRTWTVLCKGKTFTVKADNSSDRMAQMGLHGVTGNEAWAAGSTDQDGKIVIVGNDRKVEAKLREQLEKVHGKKPDKRPRRRSRAH